MNKELEAGDQIQYRLFDKKGKEHWFNGTIHGVRRYEEGGIITRITYLIDTGRNERLDEYTYSPRDREITKRFNAAIAKGKIDLNGDQDKARAAIDELSNQKDLPKHEIKVEQVRQPEQIELPVEHIRTR